MSLKELAAALRKREHVNEHGVNTGRKRVHPASNQNEHAKADFSTGYERRSTMFTCSSPIGRERVNTLPQREHENEHGVNTPGSSPSGADPYRRVAEMVLRYVRGDREGAIRELTAALEATAPHMVAALWTAERLLRLASVNRERGMRRILEALADAEQAHIESIHTRAEIALDPALADDPAEVTLREGVE